MPRKPRFFLPDVPVHVVQRGHSRDPVFFQDDDYLGYLRCLEQDAHRFGVVIHAYVLMTNHIHSDWQTGVHHWATITSGKRSRPN